MNPYVKSVEAIQDYQLVLEFENGERRVFDVKPYLSRGVFFHLRNTVLFRTAYVVSGSVVWPGGLDLSYDTLYIESRPILPEDMNAVNEMSK
jgi:hypothetical protein